MRRYSRWEELMDPTRAAARREAAKDDVPPVELPEELHPPGRATVRKPSRRALALAVTISVRSCRCRKHVM